ncbi:MAG TPA: metallopeptidase TldD-related protein, partial [Myxococcales bacterium]|nr:metallopeptidase TldD-related protein [Myxococcales bacterium]
MKPATPNLKGALDAALAAAKRLAPAGVAFARLESRRDANLRFAHNEVTSSGDVDETTLSVEITLGKRHASSDTNQLDQASIESTVSRAIGLAQVAPEDPEVMPPLGPQRYQQAAPAFDAPTASVDAAARAKMAREAMALKPGDDLQMAGFLEHFASRQLLGTSAGLRADYQHTGATLSVTARTADATGSGWAASVSHRIGDVDQARVGAVARDKAVKSAKPTKLEPGRYTVVLEPAAVAELLQFMVFSMDARSADEGRSFFARPGGGNKLGEQLFGPHITISSPLGDPLLPVPPFGMDGLALTPTTWIDKGAVKALAYSRYWAQKQGKAPTGFPGGVLMA